MPPPRHVAHARQATQFFGFITVACVAFFMMMGTVSYVASLTFVRYIYKNLKLD